MTFIYHNVVTVSMRAYRSALLKAANVMLAV